jgi:hypothetical protein
VPENDHAELDDRTVEDTMASSLRTAALATFLIACFLIPTLYIAGQNGANAVEEVTRPGDGIASKPDEVRRRNPTDVLTLRTGTPESSMTGPLVVKDMQTGTLFYVESDRRHVSAIDAEGKVLWCRDPFREPGIQPYRFKEPVIVYIGDAGWRAAGVEAAQAGEGPYLGLGFNSSQFGILNTKTGEFTFQGRD